MHAEIRGVGIEESEPVSVIVKSENSTGLSIHIADYAADVSGSTNSAEDAVAFLEIRGGKPILRVWADINSDEPTHIIDLSGAHVSCRYPTFKGNLYYIDHDGIKCHICDFEETGETAAAMEKKVLDQLWDDRLDASGCSPHFEYEIVG
jgi:hypothetical protein